MSTTAPRAAAAAVPPAAKGRASGAPRAPRRSRPGRVNPVLILLLVGPYVLVLLFLGVVPMITAVALALGAGSVQGLGLSTLQAAFVNVDFLPAVLNVAAFVLLFLPLLLVVSMVLALVIDSRKDRVGKVARGIYYLPGVVVGAPLVVLWIFMLAPQLSPYGGLYRLFGATTQADVLTADRFPLIFAIIALFSAAGGWIVVLGGSLASIDPSMLEAARMDGANAWQTAVRIKLPQLWRFVAFIAIVSFAGSTQLVVEPTLLAIAAPGALSTRWSINQLASYFAFQQNNFNAASAYALVLIAIGIAAAMFLIFGLKNYAEEDAR